MHDWQSFSHVRWECKYYVVIVPKYREKKLFGKFRIQVGEMIKDLCRQRGVVFFFMSVSFIFLIYQIFI